MEKTYRHDRGVATNRQGSRRRLPKDFRRRKLPAFKLGKNPDIRKTPEQRDSYPLGQSTKVQIPALFSHPLFHPFHHCRDAMSGGGATEPCTFAF